MYIVQAQEQPGGVVGVAVMLQVKGETPDSGATPSSLNRLVSKLTQVSWLQIKLIMTLSSDEGEVPGGLCPCAPTVPGQPAAQHGWLCHIRGEGEASGAREGHDQNY